MSAGTHANRPAFAAALAVAVALAPAAAPPRPRAQHSPSHDPIRRHPHVTRRTFISKNLLQAHQVYGPSAVEARSILLTLQELELFADGEDPEKGVFRSTTFEPMQDAMQAKVQAEISAKLDTVASVLLTMSDRVLSMHGCSFFDDPEVNARLREGQPAYDETQAAVNDRVTFDDHGATVAQNSGGEQGGQVEESNQPVMLQQYQQGKGEGEHHRSENAPKHSWHAALDPNRRTAAPTTHAFLFNELDQDSSR